MTPAAPIPQKASQQASPASGSLFAVAIAPFMTAALEARASVVLPGATFVESEGTFTNSEGRVQPLFQAIKPLAGRTNLQVIAGLAAKLGQPSGPVSPEHIRNEMALTIPETGKKARTAAS
jgi:formate dehydrogenase alpha subunit